MLKRLSTFSKWLLPLLTLIFIGLAVVQAGKNPLTCAPDDLLKQQAELAAAVTDFDQAVETDAAVALETLFQTGAAYQELALACGYIPPDVATRFVGTDVERILTLLDEVSGDPLNGQLLYTSDTLACYGCHVGQAGKTAPALDGTFTRVEETRLADPTLTDYSIEQYLIESIVQPGHYLAPGYNNVMPADFGARLTLQDLADLLLFLESQDGPSPE